MSTTRMPAEHKHLAQLQAHVMDKVRDLGVTGKKLFCIELSVEEILSNIVKYAYPDRAGDVEIECRVTESSSLEIVIRDWGIPFNPLVCELPNVHRETCDRPVGGLGVYLTRQLASALRYEQLTDGNQLTLAFQL